MLNSQVLTVVKQYLAQFAATNNFDSSMQRIFGNAVSTDIRQQWLSENFSLIPVIRVVSKGELGAANGAYAAALDEILVSADFLARHEDDVAAVAGLLLEEIGHKVDRVLNGGIDTLGDEGAIFRLLVTGQELSDEVLAGLRRREDRSMITIGGRSVEVEQQNFFGDAGGVVTNDSIVGSAGNDSIRPGLGIDTVTGGDGNDTLVLDYSANEAISNIPGIEPGISSNYSNGSGLISAPRGNVDPILGFDQVTYSGIESLNITGTKLDFIHFDSKFIEQL